MVPLFIECCFIAALAFLLFSAEKDIERIHKAQTAILGVRNPLVRITANSRLLSQRKQLMPSLQRSDELGELDRLIHNIATNVYAALGHEQDLLNSVVELVCSIDRDGTFTFVNPYCQAILLMEPDELVGRPLLEFV